jgi:hypothetical protein
MIAMDCAEYEIPQLAGTTEFKEVTGVWQLTNRVLDLPKPVVEPIFQSGQRNMRSVPVVKGGEGKAKFRPELVQTHFRPVCLSQDVVGGSPNRRQVIDQGSRPVENDIP